jgi:xanthine dehydrogenase accessory factor
MENLDVMVLRTLRDWRQAGKQRAAGHGGAHLGVVASARRLHHGAVRNGAVVGSVSGGCIEDDLIDRLPAPMRAGRRGSDRAGHAIPSGPPL